MRSRSAHEALIERLIQQLLAVDPDLPPSPPMNTPTTSHGLKRLKKEWQMRLGHYETL